MAAVVVGTGLFMAGISSFVLKRVSEQSDRELVERARHSLMSSLDQRAQRNLALAEMLARIPQVQAGIERNDRAALLKLLGPMFERLKVAYEVDNLHLHTPASVTILRFHNPKFFGDDLSSFRRIVVDVNADLQPRHGLEEGVHGIPARGVVPVRNAAGTHVGSLEIGTFLRSDWLKRIAPAGTSYTLLTVQDNGRLGVFASSDGRNVPLLSDERLAPALKGRFFGEERLEEKRTVHLRISAVPLLDYAGKTIGAFEMAVDVTPNEEAYKHFWQVLLAGLFLTIVLASAVAWLTGRRLARPIEEITLTSRQLADGRLSVSFPNQKADLEIVALRDALNVFRRNAELLRELSRRVMDTEESERRKISLELHDRVGQNLAVLNLMLGMIGSEIPANAAPAARLEEAQKLVGTTIAEVRNLMADLRPPAIDDYGLLAALRLYAGILSERSGIRVAVVGKDLAPRPSPAAEIALFRIAQEALNNVAKHARTRTVTITLSASGGCVTLAIADKGAGFDPDRLPNQASWGLATMRERAEAVGAALRVDSAPGNGTRVTVELDGGAR